MNYAPDLPKPLTTRHVTFTCTGEGWLEQIYKQLEWLKGLTDSEIKKQTKVKIE